MRILSLDIDRFGCLEDRHLGFREGLNIIKGADGSGKSTLACLIKSMLLGITEDERKQYYPRPFSGRYSARMTIETDEGRYLIARSFADGDEVYVTDLESGDDLADPEGFLRELTDGAEEADILVQNAGLLIDDPEDREQKIRSASLDNAAHLSLLRRERKRLEEEIASRSGVEPGAVEKEAARLQAEIEKEEVRKKDETAVQKAASKKNTKGVLFIIVGVLFAGLAVFYYFEGRLLWPLPEGLEFLFLCLFGGAALLALLFGIVLSIVHTQNKKQAQIELAEIENAYKASGRLTAEESGAGTGAAKAGAAANTLGAASANTLGTSASASTLGGASAPSMGIVDASSSSYDPESLLASLEKVEQEIAERTAEDARLSAALKESSDGVKKACELPVVLDDVFTVTSPERKEESMEMLRTLGRQVILLTSET